MIDKIGLNITHQSQGKFSRKNTGILCLILFKDIGLYGTPNLSQGAYFNFLIDRCGQYLITGNSQKHEA